jgi:hypothetical protein
MVMPVNDQEAFSYYDEPEHQEPAGPGAPSIQARVERARAGSLPAGGDFQGEDRGLP